MMQSTALVPTLSANGHAAGGALVINLSDRPEVLDALYKEALRRQMPLGSLVAELLATDVDRITSRATPPVAATDPDGRAAYASGRGMDVPQPEGSN